MRNDSFGVNNNDTGLACNDVMPKPSPAPLLDDYGGGWMYQTCTEMVMPLGQDGVNDMFYPAKWNIDDFIAGCQSVYGPSLIPRPSWVEIDYGSANLLSATNIFLPNGQLDPWSVGGVT